MAYSSYLIQIGSYTIPMDTMIASSYKVTYSVLDLDSYRDANGYLHRQALRKVPTVEVTFDKSTMMADILSSIKAQYVNEAERKVSATVYIPEIDDYYTGYFYIPDTPISIYKIVGNDVIYDAINFKIIGY